MNIRLQIKKRKNCFLYSLWVRVTFLSPLIFHKPQSPSFACLPPQGGRRSFSSQLGLIANIITIVLWSIWSSWSRFVTADCGVYYHMPSHAKGGIFNSSRRHRQAGEGLLSYVWKDCNVYLQMSAPLASSVHITTPNCSLGSSTGPCIFTLFIPRINSGVRYSTYLSTHINWLICLLNKTMSENPAHE